MVGINREESIALKHIYICRRDKQIPMAMGCFESAFILVGFYMLQIATSNDVFFYRFSSSI